ncbi:MAG: tRNA (N(6)-L-threonylcarbamoyladenosine(37)-C(2))-methylthiotransferase [Candidatus Thorarchaeota archaeon]
MDDATFYLETYGCSLNKADSDLIVGRLNGLGAEQTTDLELADLIVLNTCGVKEPTEDRIIHRLEELGSQSTPVIVAGCLPCISINRIQRAIPSFAALLGPQSIDTLGSVAERVLKGERGIVHLDSDYESKLRFFAGPPDSVICTIPICEGCLGSCAYCAVRFARGNVRSYSSTEIRSVVERCVHLGYREIRLTSQDASVFGHDTGETLVELLKNLDQIVGDHRFRLGMFNPNLVLDTIDGLVTVMGSDHFFKFFHVPLQTGSDSLLTAMGRRYTVAEWTGIVSKIRSKFPRATIATDIIVGFPGETESDFEETVNLLKSIRPEVVNISKYGDRPGTLASRANNKVDTSVKKDRSRQMSSIVSDSVIDINGSWVGWSGEVIATETGTRGGIVCRNFAYKRIILHEEVALGSTVKVEVTASERTHLIAQTCRD